MKLKTAVLVLIAVAAVGACKGSDDNKVVATAAPTAAQAASVAASTPAPAQPSQATSGSGFGVGDKVQVGDAQYITLQQIDAPWKSDSLLGKPKAGNMMAAFLVSFEGLDPDGSSYNPFYLSFNDASGFEYNFTAFGKDPSLKSSNDLMPGQTAQGWITFEIPATTKSGQLVYKPIAGLGGDPVRFDITFP